MDGATQTTGMHRVILGGNLMKFLYNLFNLFLMAVVIMTFIYGLINPQPQESTEIEVKGLTNLNTKVDKLFGIISGLYEKVAHQEQLLFMVAECP